MCLLALITPREKEEEIFVVDLAAGFQPESEPAATAPPPEPTAPPVTKAATPKKEETKPPVTKETPKPKPTEPPKPKPELTKKVVDTSPRKLPDKLRPKAPPPPPPPDHSDLVKKLEEAKAEVEDLAKPIPTPAPVKTPPPARTVPPSTNNSASNPALELNPMGMGRQSSNFYFVLMQRQLYKNWELKERQPGEPVRKADITVVVLKDGRIDIARCQWNKKSGKTAFDDSVWKAVEKTELPKFPAEFTMSEIQVAVTFRDEV